MGFATNAIHVGQEPDPATGAIVAPIYQTSTYVQRRAGQEQGVRLRANESSRTARRSSGRGASSKVATARTSFPPGWRASTRCSGCFVRATTSSLSEAVYGGVYRLSTQLLVQFGLEFSFVDTSTPEAVRMALRPNTKMIYIETPTNPTLSVTDIAAIVASWPTNAT